MPEIDEACSMEQVKEGQYQDELFSKVLSNISRVKTEQHITDDDIETGFEFFHAIVFCPSMVFKVYTFIDRLLTNETSRTIIQTIVHLFTSGAIRDDKTLSLTKQFYHVLASTLELQFGNLLLATSTMTQLLALKRNNWPFFENYTTFVEKCLQNSVCDFVRDIHQQFGTWLYFHCLFSLLLFQRA